MKKAVLVGLLSLVTLSACQASEESPDTRALSSAEIEASIKKDFDAPIAIYPFEEGSENTYFEVLPDGLGGYILYDGAHALYALNNTTQELQNIPFEGYYATDISSDENWVVSFTMFESPAGETHAAIVQNMNTQEREEYDVEGSLQMGEGHFSADGTQLAFAATNADPNSKAETTVYVVDLKTNEMSVYSTNQGAVKLNWNGNKLEVAAQ